MRRLIRVRLSAPLTALFLWTLIPTAVHSHSEFLHLELSKNAFLGSDGVQAFLSDTIGPSADQFASGPLIVAHPPISQLVLMADQGWSALEWVRQGSYYEDETLYSGYEMRSLDHFYTVLPRPARGLTDDTEPWYAFVDFPKGISDSFAWAFKRGLQGPYEAVLGFTTVSVGPNTEAWQNARDYQYDALASSAKVERDHNLAHALFALGHVIHLNQDLTSPDHVRNDNHANRAHRYFENYGLYYYSFQLMAHPPQPEHRGWPYWQGKRFLKLQDFWDRNLYTGDAAALNNDVKPSAGGKLGLAEFCNGNFLGEDALYAEYFAQSAKHYFPLPSLNASTTFPIVRHVLADGVDTTYLTPDDLSTAVFRVFLRKTTAAGLPVRHHSVLGYFGVVAHTPGTAFVSSSINDQAVLADYHSLLIPKAIEYSAGILDYFFRGKLTVTASKTSIDSKIHLHVVNNSGTNLYGGTFQVFADDQNGNRSLLPTLRPVWKNIDNLPDNAPYDFFFCEPTSFVATNYMLVYRGTIGTSGTTALDSVDDGIAIAATHFLPPAEPAALLFPRFANTTTVDDWAHPGLSIPPYARPNGFLNISCANPLDCGALGSGKPECNLANPIPENSYVLSPPEMVDLSSRVKAGFKNVYARKAWHGIWGFTSQEWQAHDQIPYGNTGCGYQTEHDGPDATKYLRLDVTASYTYSGNGYPGGVGDSPTSATCPRWSQVDTNSGNMTAGGSDTYSDAGSLAEALPLLGRGLLNLTSLENLWVADVDFSRLDQFYWTITGSGGVWRAEVTDQATHTIIELNMSGHYHKIAVTDYPDFETRTRETTIDLTGTTLNYTETYHYYSDDYSVDATTTWQTTATLSLPYTSEDVNDDVDSLLSLWSLTDDAQYPWRTDVNCTSGPLVTRDEWPARPPALQPLGWTDTPGFTGQILGGPKPAGYDPYFDFRHKNWNFCYDENAGKTLWYIESYGEYAPGWARHATQWTDKLDARAFMQGAFTAYNSISKPDVDGIYLQGYLIKAKYAEVLLPTHSHNFARPAARDRFVFDKLTARCVSAVSGNLVTIQNRLQGPPSISVGDTCMLVGSGGVGGVDGVYPLAGVSGNQFTLGTRICSLPAAVTSGSAFLGKLRWPLAPAIRGRVAITLAVPGNTGDPHDTLIFVDGDTMLRTGDQVVVSGCGLTSANGTWTITRLTDNSFYLNGSSTFAANATGGWVAGFNSANYIWDNNQSRGDWCLMSWVYNFRDVGEANRLHGIYLEFINPEIHCGTIADVPIPRPGPLVVAPVEQHGSDPLYCCRTIVMISPNPERRPEGTNWVLPRLTCDERYTTLGQIIPKQWMVDPLWQAPPAPCFQEDKDEWLEDDGNGLFDHEEVDPISGEPYMVRYYPQRPWEEARAYTPRPPTDPPGCPDLPPGTYLVMGSDNAPNPGTCWFAPWVIFLAEQANIQSSKRFHCEYADPQAECPGDDFVEDTP